MANLSDGGGTDGSDTSSSWPFSLSDDYRNPDADSVFRRIRWAAIFQSNVRGLVALIFGAFVAGWQTLLKVPTYIFDTLRSFLVDVVEVVMAIPNHFLESGFTETIAWVSSQGMAGSVAAVALVVVAFSAYSLGVRAVAR